MADEASTRTPGRVELRARNVEHDWSRTPLHWIPGDAVASHAIGALNFLLPEGERMFCATFHELLPLIGDEALRRDVLGFIGQESMHAETHEIVLHEVYGARGIDPAPLIRQSEFLFRVVVGPRPGQSPRRARQHLIERAALIGGLEHLFAFLGDWILNAPLEEHDADPQMLDLFRWHGAEEVEHRNVAHDVVVHMGVGYVRRNIAMVVGVGALLALILRNTRYLVRADPDLPTMGYLRIGRRLVRSMRRGTFPRIPRLLRSAAICLTPGYSPESVGDTAQALAYLAASPSARAAAQI
ncbi:metal-dependent hydrolase [Tomitella gaofuii]|uniref:metal-dependent hydrolase n=1 Tax=Tomitella gaofuii TaxID=2760083 RepID=UPI0015F8C767|nr:metal-dependent hydrolase [Tomitella gaofuii]